MAPKSKRRRSDSSASEKSKTVDSNISQLKQREDLWFDDGSIVVATDVHLYRVHKGVLAKNSSVFKDMLELSSGAGGGGENEETTKGDQWNGLPLVKMAGDSDESIYHLLMTLYDREYYRGSKSTSFPIVLSLLRLSTKYDIPAVRREVVDQLERYYPSTLEDWDDRPGTELEDFPDDGEFQLLAAARQCDVQVLLPTLFYVCSLRHLDSIFQASSQLQNDDIRRTVVGRDKLVKISYEFGVRALFPEKKCGDRGCSKARVKLLKDRMDYGSFDHPSFDLDDFEDGLPETNEKLFDEVCKTCKEKSAATVNELRRDLWHNLPAAFDLDKWDKLKGVEV